MAKTLLLFVFFLLACLMVEAQVRMTKLVIGPNETFSLGESDILVADTLVMMDSSRLLLNSLKSENYIRAQVAIFGNNATIDGKGFSGKDGRDGQNGDTPLGPCRSGTDARNGGGGLDGASGVNLFLYFETMTVRNKMIIDLSGGNGGNGGDGGIGGGGGPGTIHCKGGDAGNGGNGGDGGSGGRGGILTVSCARCSDVRTLVGKHVVLRNRGGSFGFGGRAGYPGAPGIAPNRNNGAKGIGGKDGQTGKSGERGALNFDIN